MTHQAAKMNWCNLNVDKRKIPAPKQLSLCINSFSGHNNKESSRNNLGSIYTVRHGDVT